MQLKVSYFSVLLTKKSLSFVTFVALTVRVSCLSGVFNMGVVRRRLQQITMEDCTVFRVALMHGKAGNTRTEVYISTRFS